MSAVSQTPIEPLLAVPGIAADHLYREGSRKASFWEALFGSSLSARRRTHVSARADGARIFDVPVDSIESDLLHSAEAWIAAHAQTPAGRDAAARLASKDVAVKLIGLQPQGRAIATFSLRFEPKRAEAIVDPETAGIFRSWFEAERTRISAATLIPFGFTPTP